MSYELLLVTEKQSVTKLLSLKPVFMMVSCILTILLIQNRTAWHYLFQAIQVTTQRIFLLG